MEMTREEFEKEIQAIKAQLLDSTREYGKGIQEIRDQNLVTARLLELHERESNARLERVEALADRHEERLSGVEERQASLEAAMRALFETVDRFIRGLEGNGHKGPR